MEYNSLWIQQISFQKGFFCGSERNLCHCLLFVAMEAMTLFGGNDQGSQSRGVVLFYGLSRFLSIPYPGRSNHCREKTLPGCTFVMIFSISLTIPHGIMNDDASGLFSRSSECSYRTSLRSPVCLLDIHLSGLPRRICRHRPPRIRTRWIIYRSGNRAEGTLMPDCFRPKHKVVV